MANRYLMVNQEGEAPVFVTDKLFERRKSLGLLGIETTAEMSDAEKAVFVSDVQFIFDTEGGIVYYEDYDAETETSTLGVDKVKTVG